VQAVHRSRKAITTKVSVNQADWKENTKYYSLEKWTSAAADVVRVGAFSSHLCSRR
jgi:hypothetical protein